MSTLSIVPNQDFLDLKPALVSQLERLASAIRPEQLASLLNPALRQTLAQGFADAGAHEGMVWLVDATEEHLVPAYNTGPRANEMVGNFRQPLREGLVCMVFASEQPFLENEVWKNSQQSKLLDQKLQVRTWSMIAVPFYFLHRCRGVVSCVQLKRAATDPDPGGFKPEGLASIQRACSLLTQLIDYQLLSGVLGWNSD